MRRKIPSTAALSAFESAARHQSYTKAAEEMAVTQSAICRQIAALEEFLELKLFQRDRRGVRLTDAGRIYFQKVGNCLDEVERDTLELMATRGRGETLQLAAVPTFATKWLLPRIPLFNREYPGISINLSSRTRPFLFEGTEFDAAIHAGEESWPGTEKIRLMSEHLTAVCSPVLIAPRTKLMKVDWHKFPLLQQSTRPYAWRNWFAANGIKVEGDMYGPRYELFSMLAEAAAHGLGIALIPRLLVEDELRRGVLIEASPHSPPPDRSYYLLIPDYKASDRVVILFSEWLKGQAEQYTGGAE
jgi:LysR family glycine cleavage system transcriptional activator